MTNFNWDSATGDVTLMVLGTLAFVIITLIAAKLKGEI